MPRYDYRCRTCDSSFEVTRSLTDTDAARCPEGHDDCARVFTAVAVAGSASSAPAPGGGCCGGGCCG